MALGTFVAGRYSSTISGSATGLCEQGIELTTQLMGERIEESDGYGLALIEIVTRCCNYELQMNAMEWNSAVQGALAQLGTWGAVGTPAGRLGSALASAIVMSATAGTPAANSPASISATRGMLSPSFSAVVGLNSKLRRTPLRFSLLPSDAGVAFTSS